MDGCMLRSAASASAQKRVKSFGSGIESGAKGLNTLAKCCRAERLRWVPTLANEGAIGADGLVDGYGAGVVASYYIYSSTHRCALDSS